MQLHLQLHQLKKGLDTLSDYFLKAKSIVDQLAMASKPVDKDDPILYLLGGLGMSTSVLLLQSQHDILKVCWVYVLYSGFNGLVHWVGQ